MERKDLSDDDVCNEIIDAIEVEATPFFTRNMQRSRQLGRDELSIVIQHLEMQIREDYEDMFIVNGHRFPLAIAVRMLKSDPPKKCPMCETYEIYDHCSDVWNLCNRSGDVIERDMDFYECQRCFRSMCRKHIADSDRYVCNECIIPSNMCPLCCETTCSRRFECRQCHSEICADLYKCFICAIEDKSVFRFHPITTAQECMLHQFNRTEKFIASLKQPLAAEPA